jgi:hypothetical protein
MSAPLVQVIDYEFGAFAVTVNGDFSPEKPGVLNAHFSIGVDRHLENARRFRTILGFQMGSSEPGGLNGPYNIQLEVTGYFAAAVDLEIGRIPSDVAINSVTILYGISRGVVGQFTAGLRHGKFVLPAQAFDDLLRAAPNLGPPVIERSNRATDGAQEAYLVTPKRTISPAGRSAKKKSKRR